MQWTRREAWLAVAGSAAAQQYPSYEDRNKEKPVRLPNGTLQSEAILKADYAQLLEDAGKLQSLGKEIEDELKKNDRYVLSLGLLKKLDEVEKVAKRMRGKYKR